MSASSPSGLVLSQAPETAGFDGMPRSVLKAGVVDTVGDPQDLPKLLLERYSARTQLGSALLEGEEAPRTGMDRVIEHEIDFAHYKPNTDPSGCPSGRALGRRRVLVRLQGPRPTARTTRCSCPMTSAPSCALGHGQARDRDAVRAAGFDQHLVKPVTLEQLSAAVAGLVASA